MVWRKLCSFIQVPLITGCCVALCTLLFFVNVHINTGWKHKHLCLSSHQIIRSGEVYRFFTHTLIHKGPWHLAVTMIPMLFLGTLIEKRFGSILFFTFIIICWLISTALEVAMATMLYHMLHNLFHGCSMGFSGIVFGLVVLVPKTVKFEKCNFLLFQIPLSMIPWISICAYFFGFHQGSIFLHLGGILTGYAYKYDVFICCLPSPERLAEWEHSESLKCFVNLPCFVPFSHVTSSAHNRTTARREQLYRRPVPQDYDV